MSWSPINPSLLRALALSAVGFANVALPLNSLAQSQVATSADSTTELQTDPMVTKSVSLQRVYSRLNAEVGLTGEKARKWLEHRLCQQFDDFDPETIASLSRDQVEVLSAEHEIVVVSIDKRQRGMLVNDRELVVVGSKADVQSLQRAVDTLEQFGVRQVALQTYLLRDREAVIDELPVKWSPVEAAAPAMADSEVKTSSSNADVGATHGPKTIAAVYLERQKAAETQQPELSPRPEGIVGDTWATASSVVERTTPVLYSLLSPAEHKILIDRLTKIDSIEQLTSPTVIVYNGEVASINNSTERSFVIGITPRLSQDAANQSVLFAPKVRVVTEGTKAKFLPKLIDGTKLQLGCEMEVCRVLGVETLDLPRADQNGFFSVQIPEVSTTRYRSSLEFPVDYTLALRVFEKDNAGNKSSLVMLCRCSLRDIEDLSIPK